MSYVWLYAGRVERIMTEDNNKNRLVKNIGGYVIKVGDAFVASYQICIKQVEDD